MTPNHALQPTTASVLAVPSARCASAAAEGGRWPPSPSTVVHPQWRIGRMRVNAARFKSSTSFVCALVLLTASLAAAQQPQMPAASKTRIVLLGTGTPGPLPDRSGPATAIVVNDAAYLVDFGPGVVRRASAAFRDKDIKALEPTKLRVAFVTHLHSDHTVGYPDLIFTPWTIGRRVPLEVYGPKGLKAMTEHLLEAYRVDIETRTNPNGNQREFPDGHKVNANVTVTAFATKHAMESYGYRFNTPDRSIVISGDTNPTQATIAACRGCDILIHYNALSPEELLSDMLTRYAGHFVVGRDLDVY